MISFITRALLSAIVIAAGLLSSARPASAAETERVSGAFGTTIGVWQYGCRTEQNFSFNAKTLYVEEPIIRSAASTSFTSARLTVYVFSMPAGASAWTYEPALSYSKTAAKTVPSVVQPQPVVSFGTQARPINLAFQGQIAIVERIEYLDRSGVRVGNPIDLRPSPYTFIYSYWLGINKFVTGTCQF